ncbi:MAG TPA: peptide-methionine (S)-S-oxide reductase MsrA [Gammaproteobacteria bacterium]|nr:peptide-methionine (S)-S-oxide reductase MsrA [Gammaproteobacteria bacterium]
MFFSDRQAEIPSTEAALAGRDEEVVVADTHYVNDHSIKPPFPENCSQVIFGLGCFWGAERKFWLQDGVYSTAAGYAAGHTRNPNYQEVCTGMTGHNEVVRVVYDESAVSFEQLLRLFFESHNPTQGMRQGNDRGTQYRSGIYCFTDGQKQMAEQVLQQYQLLLSEQGEGEITTEILEADIFYYAEDYHQQYLAKNPGGYCGLGGTGVTFD